MTIFLTGISIFGYVITRFGSTLEFTKSGKLFIIAVSEASEVSEKLPFCAVLFCLYYPRDNQVFPVKAQGAHASIYYLRDIL